MMHGPGGGRRRGKPEKARDARLAIKKLVAYMSEYKISLGIVLIFAIASTAAMIIGPKFMGRATTELFEGLMAQIRGVGEIDFSYIGRIVIGVLALYIISSLFSYIQGWIMANVSTDISYRLRRDISQKINRMPLKYFDGTTQGEVLSRITNDVDTVNQTLSQSITQLITSIVTVIGVLVMMFTISWLLALVSLAIIPLSMMLLGLIMKRSQKYFSQQQEYLGHVNGHIEEIFGAHIVMKAFNGEEKSLRTFGVHNNTLYGSAWKSQFFSSLMMPIMTFIGNLGYVVVAILGGWLTIQGKINIGDIQAFIQYVRSFTRPMGQLANVSSSLQQTGAAVERVFEFLEEEEEVPDVEHPVHPDNNEGLVEFRNVKFGYSPEKIIINNFSAIARPGQKVAIVGPTGSGKTTVIKLLMRFYDVNDGAILVNGHDIREYTRESLRKTFGMVLQDTWLYNDTIKNNIRYGHSEASDDEVFTAARAAHVDHFIHTLPNGYDMVINEEANNLSQGQKQLLTIARAILANPKMLILDEATSSVDTRTEILIQKAMDELMHERTSFVIAHRLSTIRNADLILVMRDGDIVEQGTHEELLKRDEYYAELHNSQFEPEELGPIEPITVVE
jgi:ATP-binding cassette subfamily B protein